MLRHPPTPTLFPYTTLFRSHHRRRCPIRLRSRDGQSRVSATVGAVDLAGRRFHGRRQSERPRRPRTMELREPRIHLYDPRPERIPMPRLRVHPSPDATFLSRSEINPTAEGAGEWSDIDAAVCHWVRRREMDAGMDATVLTELGEWIRQERGFDRIVFVTNDQFGAQTDLFQRFGFGREFKNRQPDAEGTHFGCGPQASKAKPMSTQP